jgi:hypothetical protein
VFGKGVSTTDILAFIGQVTSGDAKTSKAIQDAANAIFDMASKTSSTSLTDHCGSWADNLVAKVAANPSRYIVIQYVSWKFPLRRGTGPFYIGKADSHAAVHVQILDGNKKLIAEFFLDNGFLGKGKPAIFGWQDVPGDWQQDRSFDQKGWAIPWPQTPGNPQRKPIQLGPWMFQR